MRIGLFPVWPGTQVGGTATYDRELIRALAAIDAANQYLVFCHSRAAAADLGICQNNFELKVLRSSSRWINVPFGMPLAAAASDIELAHMTHIAPPLYRGPHAVTLHCFSHFLHPEFYPRALAWKLNTLVRRGARKAQLVICVSEGLRQLAEHDLRVPPERLTVVHNAVADAFGAVAREDARAILRAHHGIDGPFVLFVGVIAPRKNVRRIVAAFHAFRETTGADFKLVLVGRRWLVEDVDRLVEALGIGDQIVHIPHLDHASLPPFYAAAEMLVFPSLWEGFGLPVLEAMASGTPVVTSTGSCLPEVAGDAALLVDPYRVEDIAGAMVSLVENSTLADDLRARGRRRARRFAWREAAARTLAAYARIAPGGG